MVKFLALLLTIISVPVALSDDFLNKEKQLLICHNDSHFRVSWEDFEKEGKAYHVRSRNRLKSYHLDFTKEEMEDVYEIREEWIRYNEKGEETFSGGGIINLNRGYFWGETYPDKVSYHYIRVDLPDSELSRVCKK